MKFDLMVNSTASLINSTWERKAEASTTKELALFQFPYKNHLLMLSISVSFILFEGSFHKPTFLVMLQHIQARNHEFQLSRTEGKQNTHPGDKIDKIMSYIEALPAQMKKLKQKNFKFRL